MPNNNEGFEAPRDPDALEALNQLQNEGAEIAGKPAAPAPEPKVEEVKVEEKPVEVPPKEEPKVDEPKPNRTPTMVEAWKLKVAEDQHLKEVTALQAKIVAMSEQKAPITEIQKENIADEIKTIADEAGVDAGFLTKFADSILKRAGPSQDVVKTLEGIKQKEALADQLNQYSDEFSNDIEPLVKEKYQLSGEALSQLKSELQGLAFSEAYAKVPLKEIFKMREDGLGLQIPKKSSEGKGIKTRAGEVVDLENLDEDAFKNLSDADVEKLSSKSDDGWRRPGK